MISVHKVTTRDELAQLESEWNALLRDSEADTLTLTHEWLLTWWDTFGDGRELCVLLARDGDLLLGIAPLLKRTTRFHGVLPLRRVEFLASGEDEADEICSDYLDFILRRDHEDATLAAMLDFLLADATWDELLLTDIAGESPNLARLRQLGAARGLSWSVTREQMCVYVPLPDSHDTLLERVSGQNRRRLRQDRRAAQQHGARVEMIDGEDGFADAFDTLVRLHQARWLSRGKPGSFGSEKFSRFHRELAPRLLRRGWLNVWVLSLHGEPLSALYDFVYNGKIFYYQSGMSLRDGAIRSPGLLLRDFALEAAIARGLRECDFLKGEPGSYKFGWNGETRPIVQVRLARSGARETIYQGGARLVDGLRPMKRRVTGALRHAAKREASR